MSLIEVNSLCKNYKIADKEQGLSGMLKHIVAPKYHMKEAVKDINFTVEKGESVAYIGSNGAGKSTTIKMLTGILKPILSIVIMSQALMNISIQWNIGKIIMLIVFVVSASVIRVCLNIVANSSSFWLKGSRNSLPHMVYTIWEFGKYPINIFSGAIQFILLTILPYAFMGFLPAAYMFDKPIYASVALITPVVAFIWIIISVVVFRLGLNRYESTGN